MDNLKKRDYANYNNKNSRSNLPNRNVGNVRNSGRYEGNGRNFKSNEINKLNNRNVPVQYSKDKNVGNRISVKISKRKRDVSRNTSKQKIKDWE